MTGDGVELVSDFVDQEESSIMEHQKKESSKWTNERHNLYLKSIEASFVNQLYNSFDMQNCPTHNTSSDANLSGKNHPNTCIRSGQFKVLQHGSWSKKYFTKGNSRVKGVKDIDRHHVSPGNPWIQHFSNGSLKRLSSTSTSASLQYPVPISQLHQEQDSGDTEVMDQNFVEDMSRSKKRTRTSKNANSGNDQVVPHCTSDAEIQIPDSYHCSKK